MKAIRAPEVDIEELVRLLRVEQDGDALTAQELADRTGMSRSYVMKRLHVLLAEGRVQVVRRRILRIDGQPITIAAYRLAGDRP